MASAPPSSKLAVSPTIDGVEAGLAHLGVTLHTDARSGEPRITIDNAETPMDDVKAAQLYQRMERHCEIGGDRPKPWSMADRSWTRALTAIAGAVRIDPLLSWLTDLPDWDGVARWPLGPMTADDTDYTRWAAWSPIRGAVRRALTPGAEMHEMLILIGAQGCGKSSWLKCALPPHLRGRHADHVDITAPEKSLLFKLAGSVFGEIGEIERLRSRDVERMRQTITQSVIVTDRKFAVWQSVNHISWVYYATANDFSAVPMDTAGVRRFLPLMVTTPRMDDAMIEARDEWWAANREQVWAEALHTVAMPDYSPYLPDGLWAQQQEQVSAHSERSEVHAVVLDYLDSDAPKRVTLLGVLQNADVVSPHDRIGDVPHAVQQPAIAALKEAGYTSRVFRENGVTARRWCAPEAS